MRSIAFCMPSSFFGGCLEFGKIEELCGGLEGCESGSMIGSNRFLELDLAAE